MNILVEIGHPAHVHFFLRTIRRLESDGHRVSVVTRAKEMTNELLKREGISYICLSAPSESKPGMLAELLYRWTRVAALLVRRRIDVAVSISGISTSFPARALGIRNVLFTDTEDASLSNRIAFPFATRIYTPSFFLGDLGPRHRRYNGLHELAYLQHYDSDSGSKIRRDLKLPARYSLVRLVGSEALHDRDIRGVKASELESLVSRLRKFGEVIISCPIKLPSELESMRASFPVDQIHAVMAGATLFAGESPTMAVESSLLGVPAYLVSGRVGRLGNMVGLEKEHGLLRCFETMESLLQALPAQPDELERERTAWSERSRAYLAGTVDVDSLVYDAILGRDA